ncbi:MAG: hypothetical protein JNJ60_03805 [Rhodocyclaceae bacterium]|nr:hypothetical protein [Rhodocyclaceae bacterium]
MDARSVSSFELPHANMLVADQVHARHDEVARLTREIELLSRQAALLALNVGAVATVAARPAQGVLTRVEEAAVGIRAVADFSTTGVHCAGLADALAEELLDHAHKLGGACEALPSR